MGPAPRRFRGRCRNGERAPSYTGRGKLRRLVDEGSDGCQHEVDAGAPPDGVSWSAAVALRLFARAGEWPAWFPQMVDPAGAPPTVPARFESMARAMTDEAITNPLRLCAGCAAKAAAAALADAPVGLTLQAGSPYQPDPRLCRHGQRSGECWTCTGSTGRSGPW
jgi:hypothetical protein